MILTLFIFAFGFIVFGTIAYFRSKKLVGAAFILMGIMALVLGLAVVYLYPHTLPW